MRIASCLGHQSWSSTKHVYSAAMLYPFPHLRVKEEKPPLINQQSVVYEFKCDLCDTSYIAYTCRHLYQRGDEHEHSVIGKHYRDEYVLTLADRGVANAQVRRLGLHYFFQPTCHIFLKCMRKKYFLKFFHVRNEKENVIYQHMILEL